MEVKILGIILSILGISGLILAIAYVNQAAGSNHISILFAGGIFATVLFFAGIWLTSYRKTVRQG